MAAIDAFRERIRAAGAQRETLRIRGGGTKDFYCGQATGDILDPRTHAGIAAYEPTELYVTARCGTPLAELERALDEQGQMLAFEPPHYGEGSTVGGMVAAGFSGPRRVQTGPMRDFVLGVEIIDGRGELMRFGGRVMKNVAGYDVSRLMCASFGTLALITEVTLKVLPRPIAELSLRFEMSQGRAITQLNQWAGKPLPISASAWHAGVLTIRLSAGASGVASARERLGGEAVPDVEAREFWQSLREQTHPFFRAPLWRLAVPSTTPPLDLPGETLLEWHGGQRWLHGEARPQQIHDAAVTPGGHAILFRGEAVLKQNAVVSLPPTVQDLHRRIKQTFDPTGTLLPLPTQWGEAARAARG